MVEHEFFFDEQVVLHPVLTMANAATITAVESVLIPMIECLIFMFLVFVVVFGCNCFNGDRLNSDARME